jgi:hypothetical protein
VKRKIAPNDYNYTPVNERCPGASPGSCVVSSGNMLRAIALAVEDIRSTMAAKLGR